MEISRLAEKFLCRKSKTEPELDFIYKFYIFDRYILFELLNISMQKFCDGYFSKIEVNYAH